MLTKISFSLPAHSTRKYCYRCYKIIVLLSWFVSLSTTSQTGKTTAFRYNWPRGSWGHDQIQGPLKPLAHHNTMMSMGFRGILNFLPLYAERCKHIRQPMYIFPVCLQYVPSELARQKNRFSFSEKMKNLLLILFAIQLNMIESTTLFFAVEPK